MNQLNKSFRKKLSLALIIMIIFTTLLHNESSTAKADTNSSDLTPIPETTLSPTAEPTLAPVPELTETPTPEPTVMPATDLTAMPTPSITPSIAPTATPVPTSAPEVFRSKTLQLMSEYDYLGNSVTGLSYKKIAVKTLQSSMLTFGKLYGSGMPYNEYKEAMLNQWVDATEYNKKPSKVTVDIAKSMNYDAYVNTLKKLSRYEGVYLYKIGKTTEGRDLYAIEIDVKSDQQKKVLMLSGEVHAREFAGGTFIVKQFADLIQKAQTDSKTMELLKKYKYVAVPILNVDGREALITKPGNWTTYRGELWKAYTNGTDGNRNFPGLQWGQVLKGNYFKNIIASKPGFGNYPGKYAGSNNETKAMMKWIYHYVVVEQASCYLDLHEQGAIVYAGKSWQTKLQEQKSLNLRTNLLSLLNKGITRRKYNPVYEDSTYGLQGEGSSLTDYSVTLAIGAKFSPAYGFSAFTDGKKEYMLMQIKDLDRKSIKIKEVNKDFATITLEIGYGTNYLGNSSSTRRLLANEYNYYNYGKILETLPSMI